MKKLLNFLLAATMLIVVGCDELLGDDSLLGDQSGLTEEQVAQLEELCEQMNINISSLQTLVTALQSNDFVTSAAQIRQDGKPIGYMVSFLWSDLITIYNNIDTDGLIPNIGVMQAEDDIYYWTLNGDWLLDKKGNKIKAEGEYGGDSNNSENDISPKFQIEEGRWFVSFDAGQTWIEVGTIGEEGIEGGSMFVDVDITDSEYVIFSLSNDIELTLPRHKTLSIAFDVENGTAYKPGTSFQVGYTVNGADEGTTIETISDGCWNSKITKTSVSEGYITITSPESGGDGKVIMFATTSAGFTTMKAICFEEGMLTGIEDAYNVGSESSILEVELTTNFDYTVNIPEDAKAWISVADTRAEMRTETLTFTIAENPLGDPVRSAEIELVGKNGEILQSFVIVQKNNVTWRVRTVVGELTENGDIEIKDGPFGDCGSIMNAATFAADPLNPLHIYVSSDLYTGGKTTGAGARSDIRLIDFEKQEVHTIFTASYFGQSRIRDVRFTRDAEANMLVVVESGNPSVILVKRKADGMTGKDAFANQPWDGLSYTSGCNGMDVHPKTGSMFFNSYFDGAFWKFPDYELNPDMTSIYDCLGYDSTHDYHKSKKMFAHGERYLEMRVEIHPDGNYMLILQINGGTYIGKSMYNAMTDTFGMMSAYIGMHSTAGGGSGYVDDVGTKAKTNSPRQIAWVKNPEYAGNTDEYDAYFTDRSNHCIRKITPAGVVSTFAGRGSGTGNPWGYADGLARGEALFDCPCALIYNEERNVFWVGDTWNGCVREIYFK